MRRTRIRNQDTRDLASANPFQNEPQPLDALGQAIGEPEFHLANLSFSACMIALPMISAACGGNAFPSDLSLSILRGIPAAIPTVPAKGSRIAVAIEGMPDAFS